MSIRIKIYKNVFIRQTPQLACFLLLINNKNNIREEEAVVVVVVVVVEVAETCSQVLLQAGLAVAVAEV